MYHDIIIHHTKEVISMKMVRVLIQLPRPLKSKLDGLRRHGTSISGFIRSVVERELNQPSADKKGR
jgi:hypothetical protein